MALYVNKSQAGRILGMERGTVRRLASGMRNI